jgi:NAD(P)-dependent dehydrogenase (short-subunit alcohol dehydrogenase family)
MTFSDGDYRVWLITGASSGLGRALAEAALGAGDRVIATARDPSGLTSSPAVIPARPSRPAWT